MTEVTNIIILQGLRKGSAKPKASASDTLGMHNNSKNNNVGNPILTSIWGRGSYNMEVQVRSLKIQRSNASSDPKEMQFNLDQTEYIKEQALIRIVVYKNKMSQLFNF